MKKQYNMMINLINVEQENIYGSMSELFIWLLKNMDDNDEINSIDFEKRLIN